MRNKVLVVDDSRVAQAVVRTMLAGRYHVVTASSGMEALCRAAREKPDLVLLDRVMPGMDGLTVARILRAENATRDLPIVMLSVRGGPDDRDAAVAAGCDGYLTKPVDEALLLRTIGALLVSRGCGQEHPRAV